ncbi:cadherin domain-containing protein [Marinoscillum pacificum]|uniref:cadherin domain-containing protein n=1 Tax=Marinoscillum pacificum TaxID=392723 RepID=UPI0021583F67|nr:cadherin domain-containing protein [Marinoscillum pacificum]
MKKYIILIVTLFAMLKSWAADPGWSVSPASYSYSMTVTAVLDVNCTELTNASNRLGAFVGANVRGSVLSATVVNGKYVALLTVYSNTISGEDISFKIYDEDNDQIIDATTVLAFQDDASYGTPSVPQVIRNNHPPVNLVLDNLDVDENNAVGDVIGNLSVDDEDTGDSHTFTLVAGDGDTDNASFTITGSELKLQEVANFEVKESYEIRVEAADAICSIEAAFVIDVNNLNETPTNLTLSNLAIDEGVSAPFTIGTLGSEDEDTDETFTYSLVAGTGDTDNGTFEIDGTSLVSPVTFDFETQPSYFIRIRTTDSGGEYFEAEFEVTVNDLNESPSNLALSGLTVDENQDAGTAVGTLSADDPDTGEVLTYAFVTGTNDNASFQLSGIQLSTNEIFNYEEKSEYTVVISVTDSENVSIEETFTISVVDLEETPTNIELSNTTVAENNDTPLEIATLTSEDNDADETFTYTLVAGTGDTDNATFSIEGEKLVTSTAFDFETQSSFAIRLRTTDSANEFFEKSFTISITDVNETPSNLALSTLSIEENQEVGTVLGTLSADDPDTDEVLTYEFVEGENDNASFTLNGTELFVNEVFSYEVKNEYSVTIKVTDSEDVSIEETFTISIIDQEETPTDIQLSSETVAEENFTPLQVAIMTSTDDDTDETFTYTLVTGDGDTDNTTFSINGDTLFTSTKFDFETKSSYSIRLRTTDSADEFFEKSFTITITDVNEPPYDLILSSTEIEENQAVGSVLGTLSVSDQDAPETLTFELVEDGINDNSLFELVDQEIRTKEVFNYEIKNEYTLHVKVSDSENQVIQETYTVSILDVEEAPTAIQLSNSELLEGNDSSVELAALTSTDEDLDETFTYTLVAGDGDTDNASFTIEGDRLIVSTVFDFETKSSYSIRIRTTDSANETYEEAFIINVLDNSEAPYDFTLSNQEINENLPIGTVIGVLDVEDDDTNPTVTYSFTDGNDSDVNAFQIVGNELQSAVVFDFEQKSSYSIAVIATDNDGLTVESSWDISILNLNETPEDLELDNRTIKEDQPIGTLIGYLSVYDDDKNESITFSLTSSLGENNNTLVEIIDEELVTSQVLNFADNEELIIEVTASDSEGASVTAQYTIEVEAISASKFPSIDIVTPNGDGINDTWTINNVVDYANYSVKIFNANGQLVFSVASNYDNEWNGNNNGVITSTGVYYYEVLNNTFPGKKFTGTISLLK